MRHITLSILIFTSPVKLLSFTTYYVSKSGNDSNNGVTTGTPFLTIGKAVSVSVYGDYIALNKGDTWNEELNPISGINFISYGSGNMPIVTGFQTLSGWSNIGNIWSSTFTNSVKYQNTVFINGALRAKGRYPNTGWLTYTSHSGTNQITGSLSGTPDYTSGQVVIRNNSWVINTQWITSQSGGTINFSPASYYPLVDNYGYFIENINSVLDTANEWSCDTTSHIVQVYALSQPTVKASSIDTLVYCGSKNNITFDGIYFEGANMAAFDVSNSSGITIKNCTINNCGQNGIKGQATLNLTVLNTTIKNCWNDAAIFLNLSASSNYNDSYNLFFNGNNIDSIGMTAGMGQSGNQASTAIDYFGNGGVISYNNIKNTGYIPIFFQGYSNYIWRNYIDSFCIKKDDGGGIYTNGVTGKYLENNRIISNIILHGFSVPQGTPSTTSYQAYGIYHDDYSHNVISDSNTVAYCAGSGMFVHDADSSIIRNNTFAFNGSVAGSSQMGYVNLSGTPYTNLYVTGNLCYADSLSYVLNMSALGTTMASLGTMDSNYYSKPLNDSQIVKYGSFYWSLHQWQDSGKDIHSSITPTGITSAKAILLYNTSIYPVDYALGGTFIDLKGTSYTNVIELKPYQSSVLFKAITNIPQQNYPLKTALYKITQ